MCIIPQVQGNLVLYIGAGTIRSAVVSISIRYGPCRYDTYSIHIYVHDLRFQNQEQQSECFGLIYTVNPINAKAKAK